MDPVRLSTSRSKPSLERRRKASGARLDAQSQCCIFTARFVRGPVGQKQSDDACTYSGERRRANQDVGTQLTSPAIVEKIVGFVMEVRAHGVSRPAAPLGLVGLRFVAGYSV